MIPRHSTEVFERGGENPYKWRKPAVPLAEVYYNPYRDDFEICINPQDGSESMLNEVFRDYLWRFSFDDFVNAEPSLIEKVLQNA